MSMKKRTDNWEKEEKIFLLELTSQRIRTIENKQSDVESVKKKNAAWSKVHNEFCAKFGKGREKTRLKEQYQRLKLKAKEEYRAFKNESKKTGGGPPPKSPGPLSEFLYNLMPDEFIKPCNPYDEDGPG